ncbi:penicillin-binding transpeptidase domain-containing protein [Clostridium sp. YIM B02551]|uniref:penicillin-binding transpeptidase domain-containing protein n=1 Tax=Clostridium sp. YIM B02551 TaxID=2910679 RepID=UPI001EEC1F2F|nr:penicillin-binding transpeptidase domain-containing protein [Clostridium sp. YIM B02551]
MNKKKNKFFNRYTALISIMFIIFGVILGKLIYLQVYKYADYKDMSNNRSRRFVAENAPRGIIYDENGNILATNVQSYTITFTSTDESNASFYDTMNKTFKILNDNGEKIEDDMQLKIDANKNYYFDFNVSDAESIKALNIRFKKDRGLDDKLKKKLFPKKTSDLTSSEQNQLDEAIYKYSPEDTFYYMIESYNMYEMLKPASKDETKKYQAMSGKEILALLLKSYSLEDVRKYMVVKDAIKMQSFKGYKPVTLATIKKETSFIFYQRLNDLPGIDVSTEPVRSYPYGSVASAVLGYIGSIDGGTQARYEEKGYDVSTDKIGKAGIESAFESILKGTKGGTTVKVNSKGRKTEELFKLEPSPGMNVHLTIDKNIQYSAEKSLQSTLQNLRDAKVTNDVNGSVDLTNATRGAVVVQEVKTGRILALASYPSFDPNIFSTPGALTQEISKQYFPRNEQYEAFASDFILRQGLNKTVDDLFPKNKDGIREDRYDLYPKPLYDYATFGLTPPGSTFKPLTSVAALQEGVITPGYTIQTKKYYDLNTDIFGDTKPEDEATPAMTDLKRALAVSSNYYYYNAAIRMYKKYAPSEKDSTIAQKVQGLDMLAKYAWQTGLGSDPNGTQKSGTGIEIPENFGQVYNFQSFKNNTINLINFNLVDYAKSGAFPGRQSIVKMDLGLNTDDSDKLADAKKKVKQMVKDELNQVGTKDIRGDFDNFYKALIPAVQEIYDNSPTYQQSVSNSNVSAKSAVNSAAREIANYVIYSVSTELMSATQIAYGAIGQGMDTFTPLQLVGYISTVVNGGTRYKAHLVDKITDKDGKVVEEFKPEVLNKIDISPENLAAIKLGMNMANTADAGTASSVMNKFPISSGGKTGTATFRQDQSEYGREAFGVYVTFAPLDDPQIAVCTVLYDGGHGYFGANIAKAVYETYFRDQLKAMNYTPEYDYTLNPPLADVKVSPTTK